MITCQTLKGFWPQYIIRPTIPFSFCFSLFVLTFYVRLLPQVKSLEDENKKLDTKLKILKEQEDYDGKIDNIVRQIEDELQQQIDSLLRDQEKLQAELRKNQEEVEDTKKRSGGHDGAHLMEFVFLFTV